MLSRVADAIYWLSRYIERAENVARFLDVNLNLLLDMPTGVEQQWKPLVITTGDLKFFNEHYGEFVAEQVVNFLTFDRQYPNSIVSCVRSARENARSVREAISSEMWQQVNDFYMLVTAAEKAQGTQSLSDLTDFLAAVKQASHSFNGVMDATMTHNEGWHFGHMGRLLERADKTSRILDVKYYLLLPSAEDVGTPIDELGWMALLKSASAYEMYRKSSRSYQHRITPAGVAEFLILDVAFPRSIRFCLRQTEQSLHQISGTPFGAWRDPVERALGRLRSELEYLTIEEIIKKGMHEFLDNLQQQMNDVDGKIYQTFMALPPLSSQSQTQ
ncbi:alpha-E domain-containing protein [Synechococcales cyanobacterium C]|uniref:Alpha-E domain-containing protein n=1 Tax=Petrachloros mirabilis ULC683 TaxID=2781853 RepID=A0A8K1ZW58_9CYAN|nr:alpha-E domain-containing protein [Petrachloros mirabilis]NCJ06345.1 alpha-E domain-containing protein [Petrachloros mirabilis ULC683]